MLKEPVFLVLGAAASLHLGFPLGKDLPKLIQDEILGDLDTYRALLSLELEGSINWTHEHEYIVDQFIEHLYFIQTTIDSFIGRDINRVILGKAAIYSVLAKKETRTSFQQADDNWYTLLWNRLNDGCETLDQFLDSLRNLRILTFNYDRSLEEYLYKATQIHYNVQDKSQDKEKLDLGFDALHIKHVYGQIGALPFQNSCKKYYQNLLSLPISSIDILERPYSPEKANKLANLLLASKMVRVFTENNTDEEQAVRDFIKRSMSGVVEMFFFGFGFNDSNCKLFEDGLGHRGISLQATIYGLGQKKIDTKVKKFFRRIGFDTDPMRFTEYTIDDIALNHLNF